MVIEGGPHVSIRKQAPEAMTPVDLVERGSVSTGLVALLWMLYEHHGVVLFSGGDGGRQDHADERSLGHCVSQCAVTVLPESIVVDAIR